MCCKPYFKKKQLCTRMEKYNDEVQQTEQCKKELQAESAQMSTIPSSQPPSYEHVLAESQITDIQDGEYNVNEKSENTHVRDVVKVKQIIHKSSKELYKAVAAQWGITCKMSDHCRCLDCQGNYLDCEYDNNEHEKTDGGLGAGAPMFLSEVIHGTACSIL